MEMKEAAAAFAVLAQETRLALVRLLASHGASGLAAGEIAAELGVAASTLSFHLAALEQAGLIRSRRQGRRIIYAVRFVRLRQLLGFLAETSFGGRGEFNRDLAELLGNNGGGEEASPMQPTFNVIFICTRNSARSILAEAILEKIGGGRFNAYSAGTAPAERPMPEVIERLAALGHDVSQLRSKAWTEFSGPNAPRMDFVLTLCDVPAGEACPDLGARPITASWPFPDPAQFTGSAVERTALLNGLYSMIRRRLEAFTSLPFGRLDEIALRRRLDELGDTARMTV